MKITPLKSVGGFVLGASADAVRKIGGSDVISEPAEVMDGIPYPASDIFPSKGVKCEYDAADKLASVELTKGAVLEGTDLFTFKTAADVLAFLKKHDDTAHAEGPEVFAPKLGITVFEGDNSMELVQVMTLAFQEQRRKEAEEIRDVLDGGEFDDDDDDDEDEEGFGDGGDDDDDEDDGASRKRGRDESDE